MYILLLNLDLRWMQIRRRADQTSKVAMSFDRHGQLNEIFSKLDYGKVGVVKLSDLKEASDFVEVRMKASKTIGAGSKNLYQVFQEMDQDGNGAIDR